MDKPFYEIDGRKYPRVTSIIGQALGNNYVHVPVDVMAIAAQYGTAMHKAVELYLKNELDETTLDAGLFKGFNAFKDLWHNWTKINPGKLFRVEQLVHSTKYGFAGTCDIAWLLKNKNNPADRDYQLVLIDIKTRKTNIKYDALQLAAYGLGFDERTDAVHVKSHVLEIEHTGKAKMVNVDKPSARQTFLAALQIYNWRE